MNVVHSFLPTAASIISVEVVCISLIDYWNVVSADTCLSASLKISL